MKEIKYESDAHKKYIEFMNYYKKHPIKYYKSFHGIKFTLFQKIYLLILNYFPMLNKEYRKKIKMDKIIRSFKCK